MWDYACGVGMDDATSNESSGLKTTALWLHFDDSMGGNFFLLEPAFHSISEELVVYPVFEKNLTIIYDQQIAQKDREEH
ncbi:hypothetical protein N5P37_011283 [Trichoderma harzianum]|nr:hypothetical protein N5P37_011283 [Trichoderma harzianum]